ncbi:MAG: ABC transporter substrate-binding protein [Oscillospiraceae bacterium]|nr:ABC transporter substrate-binding protein [Oscillospiraceae bacterium]
MKNVKRMISFVVIAALMVVTITGCVQQSIEPGTGTTTDTRNNVLNVAVTATPEAADAAMGAGENCMTVFNNVYEGLVRNNRESGMPEPMLAKSWESSPDGMTWTFFLRDDVHFADGSPMTAADVKYSMDRFLTIGRGQSSIFQDVVEETQIVDEHTVRFVLARPFGPFITAMTQFMVVNKTLLEANTLSSGPFGTHGDFGTGFALAHSVGSGPYIITNFEPNVSLTLTKNENYWRIPISEAAPDVVNMFVELEGANIRMLSAVGGVDIIHGRSETITLNAVLDNPGWRTVTFEEPGHNYFMFNTRKAPTDCVHIRRAIAYATDSVLMAEISGDMPLAYGVIPNMLLGSATSGLATYDFNLERAREQVALSVYADTLANYPISISNIQGNGETGRMCMILGESLSQIGFNVQLIDAAWVLFVNNQSAIETSPNVTNLIVTANFMEAGSLLEFRFASYFSGSWNQNEWLLSDEFDDRIADAFATINDEERFEKYRAIEEWLVNDLVVSYSPFVSALRPAWNSDVFSWPADEGRAHVIPTHNYYFAYFTMR